MCKLYASIGTPPWPLRLQGKKYKLISHEWEYIDCFDIKIWSTMKAGMFWLGEGIRQQAETNYFVWLEHNLAFLTLIGSNIGMMIVVKRLSEREAALIDFRWNSDANDNRDYKLVTTKQKCKFRASNNFLFLVYYISSSQDVTGYL